MSAEKKKPSAKPGKSAVPDRARLVEKEDFGENTFAGALEAVKGVLEKASSNAPIAPPKPRKKGSP
jgi:hypothetical protein